ncbi:hypothetical protein J3A83DRAFT_3213973 [Scleroderma citrinum]
MLPAPPPWSGYAGPRRSNTRADGSIRKRGPISRRQRDILIALIGPAGCGKSSFIATAIGSADESVGHRLCAGSHTQEVTTSKYTIGSDSNVVLVDTPGFGDANKCDLQILCKISKWLHETYKKKVFFSAILCFQPISDNRIRWEPWNRLSILQELCGNDTKAQIVLVTTMWDEVDKELGMERLADLKENYWSPNMTPGSRTFCYWNSRESTTELLQNVVEENMRRFCTSEPTARSSTLPVMKTARNNNSKLQVDGCSCISWLNVQATDNQFVRRYI